MTYFIVPEHEKWRQEFIGELLDGSIANEYRNNDVNEMLQIVCTT